MHLYERCLGPTGPTSLNVVGRYERKMLAISLWTQGTYTNNEHHWHATKFVGLCWQLNICVAAHVCVEATKCHLYKNERKKKKQPSNNDLTSTKDDPCFFVGKGWVAPSLSLTRLPKLITKDTTMSVVDPCVFSYRSIKRPKNTKHSKKKMMHGGSSHKTSWWWLNPKPMELSSTLHSYSK